MRGKSPGSESIARQMAVINFTVPCRRPSHLEGCFSCSTAPRTIPLMR